MEFHGAVMQASSVYSYRKMVWDFDWNFHPIRVSATVGFLRIMLRLY